jgi:tRNA-specific 2-thiouridylase
MDMDKSKIKVCVGLSGGVDSSVAALLLKQEGYDVFAMFMQNWDNADVTLHGNCEWEEDRFVAEMVARKIGIPFYFVNLSGQYRSRVADYMFDEYSKGRTPNPDVLCNREIKFDAFVESAVKMGADMVATGHYCRKEPVIDKDGKPVVDSAGHPLWRLLAGVDPNKDQSYFLCQLSQYQLSMAIFPIGGMDKPKVRQIAKDADLPSAEKKDSQGICFIGKVDLPTFLKQKIAPKEGQVIEVYDEFYSHSTQYSFLRSTLNSLMADPSREAPMVSTYISEDKSLKVNDIREHWVMGDPSNEGGCSGPSPYSPEKAASLSDEDFMRLSKPVTYEDIKFEQETYRAGRKHQKKVRWKANPYGKIIGVHDGAQFYTIGQHKGLGIGGHTEPVFVIANDMERNIVYVGEGHTHKGLSRNCLRISPDEIHWVRPDLEMKDGEARRFRVRIRYRQPLQDATLFKRACGMFILFDEPQRGITPGQFAVWYDCDEVIGSGAIAE